MIILLMAHIVSYMTFQMDIKSQKEQELEQLRYKVSLKERQTTETETQFDSLTEIIDSAIILINEHEKITQINSLFNEYFDIVINEGDSIQQLKEYRNIYKAINEAFIGEKKHRAQIKYDSNFYDINITPVFDGKMFHGCLVVIHDITQLKTAETFQKQFTADVSHELKTPLSAIKGFAEILTRDEYIDEKEKKDFLETIYQESVRLETILNDLLIISKMDRLDYELDLEKTSMEAIITNAKELLEPLAKEKNLELNCDIVDAVIYVDSTKIRQVMINLITNGLNYTDQGGVYIKSYLDDDDYVIEVKDTGIGIDKDEQEKVFKRFYRVDEARSRTSGGSGLGLSIIKNVVRKHEGTIELHSEKGNGSIFIIKLPRIHEIG
ncbi:MAG: sensor histidine kinase [Candidatus Izemoplasmataceae bacterium]